MLSKDEVKHIAELARIGVNEKEVEKLTTDLSAVLDWMKELETADVAGVSPTARVNETENISREDWVHVFESREKIVELFPEKKNGYDKVRSVL